MRRQLAIMTTKDNDKKMYLWGRESHNIPISSPTKSDAKPPIDSNPPSAVPR